MVSFGQSSGPVEPFAPGLLAAEGLAVPHPPDDVRLYRVTRDELERSAAALFEAVRSGKVKIEVRQRFPLADAAEAHRALEARETSGSTILTVD